MLEGRCGLWVWFLNVLVYVLFGHGFSLFVGVV